MKQRLRHFIYFILLITADQLTKYWARTFLAEKGPIDIIPDALVLQYHRNTGAVWGILQGQVSILSVITIILMILLIFIYFKIPEGKKYTPLKLIWVFIIAGAIGNFIDRITLKYVVDFVYFSLIDFPIFNIADSYLTISSILMLILVIFYYKGKDLDFLEDMLKRRKKPADNDETTGKDE